MVSLADWRVPLAVVAALTLLLGATALTSQVEGELEGEIEARRLLEDAKLKPSNELVEQLDLHDLRLPDDLDVTLPEGTEISADLSKLKLDDALDIDLPPNFPLEDLAFDLPRDFDLSLPPGSLLDPEGLTLPEGATLTMPDGATMTLPPGTRLDLPPEAVDQLVKRFGGFGAVSGDAPIRGLPPGLKGSLDMPALPEGGTLTLPPGTEIALPPGMEAPFPPGVLDAAERWTLPRGTTFDWPALLAAGALGAMGGGGEFPMVRPNGGTADDCPGCIGPYVEITSTYPEKLRKGEPFPVEGFVESGPPTRGVPITIFLNETKEAPGRLVGKTVTDANGHFSADVTLPADLPARNYQLVARSAPYTGADGRARSEGWSDPPIAFIAETTLDLVAPERDGIGARIPVTGTLVDDAGAPVVGATVRVLAGGVLAARATTDESGAWSAGVTFESAGKHWLRAVFDGDEFHTMSEDAQIVEVADFAIDVPTLVTAERGSSVTLTGRVLESGEGVAGVSIGIDSGFAGVVTGATGPAGDFSIKLSVPADAKPGDHLVRYSVGGQSIEKAQALRVTVTGSWVLKGPELAPVGRPAPLTLHFLPSSGVPVGIEVPFDGHVTGEGGVTPLGGRVPPRGDTLALPVSAPSGLAGEARVAVGSATPAVIAKPATFVVRFGHLDVSWDLPDHLVRGESSAVAGVVLLDGDPFPHVPVEVAIPGVASGNTTADASGRFAVALKVPRSAALGPATVNAILKEQAHQEASTVPIKARTRIDLATPEDWRPGTALQSEIRVLDDRGEPVPGAAVTWEYAWDDAEAGGRIGGSTTANVDGRVPAHLSALPEDDAASITFGASFPATDEYLAASAETVIPPRGAFTIAGVPAKTLAQGGGVLLVLVGAAVAAPFAYRALKRRARSVTPFDVVASGAAGKRGLPIEVVELEDGLPLVFGVGDIITARAPREASWTWDGDAVAAGTTEARVRLSREGDFVLAAVAAGVSGRREVRVVDYRKEIAREFDVLLDAATPLAPGLTRRASAREVEAALMPHARGPDARRALDEVVGVLEHASYSHHDVARSHYVRFHRAAAALASTLVAREAAPRA